MSSPATRGTPRTVTGSFKGHHGGVKRRLIETAAEERKQHRIAGWRVASQRLEDERVVDARPAIVQVPSHSRQRHKVVTVMVLANVSIRLPWQNGHAVGRSTASLNRDSDIVAVTILFSSRFPHCSL